jgi:predicted oxidoreductase
VTFTEGGIKVNTECQALDRDGRPVPGLYVAGVDVGAISNVGYAGALSAGLITGLRAGLHGSRWHDAEARSRHRSS